MYVRVHVQYIHTQITENKLPSFEPKRQKLAGGVGGGVQVSGSGPSSFVLYV